MKGWKKRWKHMGPLWGTDLKTNLMTYLACLILIWPPYTLAVNIARRENQRNFCLFLFGLFRRSLERETLSELRNAFAWIFEYMNIFMNVWMFSHRIILLTLAHYNYYYIPCAMSPLTDQCDTFLFFRFRTES